MLIRDVSFVKGAAKWVHLMEDGVPEVAFVGRSNVGKSSLLNMVVGRKQLARTSGTPGKTQELNYYLINKQLYFVDVPGLGYARVSKTTRQKWERFIVRYLTEREPLQLICHLIDSRHPPTAIDKEVLMMLKGGPPRLLVLTKSDKLSRNQQARSVKTVKETLAEMDIQIPMVLTSAKTKLGRDEILQWITDLVHV